jgi:hypothetical protein
MTMAASVGHWRATYAPGTSLILAGPTSLVLLREPATVQETLVNALWEQVLRSATISELAARLAVFSVDKIPGFAALFWTPKGMRSLVRGDVSVTDPASGRVIATGSDIETWSESGLGNLTRVSVITGLEKPGPVLPLVVGVAYASWVCLDASAEAQVTSPQVRQEEIESVSPVALAAPSMRRAAYDSASITSEDPWGSDDYDGPDTEPMPAVEDDDEQPPQVGRAVDGPIGSTGASDSEPRFAEPVVDDILEADTRLMDVPGERGLDPQLVASQQVAAAQAAMPPPVSADVNTPPTLPLSTSPPQGPTTESLIMAADCPHGHSNPPAAATCRMCGAPIPPQRPRLIQRPVLCVLQASDGTTADVDRAVLVGRAPDPNRSNFKAPRLMPLQSPGHDISRTHVEVAPEGWQVLATDLNSTNGTVLIRPGGYERQQLAPGEHVPVQPGSVLELGDGVSITVAVPS